MIILIFDSLTMFGLLIVMQQKLKQILQKLLQKLEERMIVSEQSIQQILLEIDTKQLQ